jgi:plasmid stabilization system protein ParE
VSKAEALATFPRRERVVPEYEDEDVREIIVFPYRIAYQVSEESHAVAIARIWHGARGKLELS